jgi:excisionase family DNA binding protein
MENGMEAKEEPLTQSVRQAAQDLGIGVNQAYEAVRRGEIPHIKIGKRILVLRKPWLKKLQGEA